MEDSGRLRRVAKWKVPRLVVVIVVAILLAAVAFTYVSARRASRANCPDNGVLIWAGGNCVNNTGYYGH